MPLALLHHPDTHRLGKLAAKPPRMRISNYVDVEQALPVAPEIVDNSNGQRIPLGMYLNDHEGDCTCAGAANTLRVNSKGAKQLTDGDVQTAYVDVTRKEGAAFNPQTGENDNGCIELDVLDYWTKIGIGGNKLLGHAGVNMHDLDEVRVVCWLFGSVYLGAMLQAAQQSQAVWDYVKNNPDWGGHCPPIFDRVPLPELGGKLGWKLGTWKIYKSTTDEFVLNQADEGHALITDEWLKASRSNPLVNDVALAADLKKFRPE